MLNRTIIQGRLTKDVELRHTQSGTAVASFTVAWSEKYKEQERKLFLPCVAWGGTGEFASKYFTKGAPIIVEGYLSTRSWTDNNGNNRQTTELTADKIHFAGKKETQTTEEEPVFEEIQMDNGDLPF